MPARRLSNAETSPLAKCWATNVHRGRSLWRAPLSEHRSVLVDSARIVIVDRSQFGIRPQMHDLKRFSDVCGGEIQPMVKNGTNLEGGSRGSIA